MMELRSTQLHFHKSKAWCTLCILCSVKWRRRSAFISMQFSRWKSHHWKSVLLNRLSKWLNCIFKIQDSLLLLSYSMRGPQLDLKVSFEKKSWLLLCSSTTQKKKSTAENIRIAHWLKITKKSSKTRAKRATYILFLKQPTFEKKFKDASLGRPSASLAPL